MGVYVLFICLLRVKTQDQTFLKTSPRTQFNDAKKKVTATKVGTLMAATPALTPAEVVVVVVVSVVVVVVVDASVVPPPPPLPSLPSHHGKSSLTPAEQSPSIAQTVLDCAVIPIYK